MADPRKPDPVDLGMALANAEILARAMGILIIRSGGVVRLTAREVRLLPKGALFYALEPEPDGGLVMCYVRQDSFASDLTKEQAAMVLPDTPIETPSEMVIRMALSKLAIEAGEFLLVERMTHAEIARMEASAIRIEPLNGDGFEFRLEQLTDTKETRH